MRLSVFFLPTLKEEPNDAVVISHKLMIRAGMIRKLGSGLYSYLPLGLRVFKKVENIIREEMNKAGAMEFSLPILTPAELWEKSGRWNEFGPEMFRINDRSKHPYALGPTHEEVFTELVRLEINSYKDLPVNFYQIKTKFRDEIRPRFGVMRGREFTMKDAYSFDVDEAGLDVSYSKMREAYKNIFRRCGLDIAIVDADTGAMGGKKSEEFMVVSDIGEEVLVSCPKCGYAANLEKAVAKNNYSKSDEELLPIEKVSTPDVGSIEDLVEFFKTSPEKFIKTIIYIADSNPVAVLIRGDIEINEVKLKNSLKAVELQLADSNTIEKVTGAKVGFAGPVNLKNIKIIADESIKYIVNGITGANETDFHFKNVNYERDFQVDEFFDLSTVKEGDLCINCSSKLEFRRGIEVGHIFKLGTKYTESMEVKFLDKDNAEKHPIMGCYGIGVDRTVAAIIEQSNDKFGIIWPITVAPFEVIVIPVPLKSENARNTAFDIYNGLLKKDYEVLIDDREVSPGFKFKDADLIGIPIKVIVGDKNLKNNKIELKLRKNNESILVDLNNAESEIESLIKKEYSLYE